MYLRIKAAGLYRSAEVMYTKYNNYDHNIHYLKVNYDVAPLGLEFDNILNKWYWYW